MHMGRDRGLDVAKGLAILLIVAGHVLRGLSAAGTIDLTSPGYEHADTALYLVHLSTFVLLAGLFVERSVRKRGQSNYLWQRALDFSWVFLVWTALQGFVKVLTSSLVNTPLTLSDLALEFVRPTSQLWFLPFILTMTAIAVITQPWLGRRRYVLSALAGVVSAAAWGFQGHTVGTLGWGLFEFFVVGVVSGYGRLVAVVRGRTGGVMALASILVFVLVLVVAHPVAPTSGGATRTPTEVALGIMASYAGTFALVWAAMHLGSLHMTRPLAYLGEHSMEVFLAHIIFASGVRIFLAKAGLGTPPVQIVAGLIAGIIGPLLLVRLSEYRFLAWLFITPSWLDAYAGPHRGTPRNEPI